ncbi:MAG: lamin tail domain-containing protein [Nannocystaceae bacterium]
MTCLNPRPTARALALALALAPALAGCSGGGVTTEGSATETTSDATSDTTTGETGETTGDTAAVCGDGVVGPGEACDGAELGDQTCAGLGAPFSGGALGCAADCLNVDASACDVDLGGPVVRVNEIFAKGADEGQYADMGDLIELVNVGGAAVDLAGWRLTDTPGFLDDKTYVFPAGTMLVPGAFLILREYNDSVDVGDFPFGISSSKEETLLLARPEAVIVDAITFDGSLADPSYCRLPDGTGQWATCSQTPGATNQPTAAAACGDGAVTAGEQCDGTDLGGASCASVGAFSGGTLACTGLCTFDTAGCTATSTVAINEVGSSDNDLIELYNAGAAPIDLSGWTLTDDTTSPYVADDDAEKLVFDPGTTIAAGGFLVIDKGDGIGQHPFGLSASGDSIRLFDGSLQLIDAVTYGGDQAAISYCRLPDGPGGVWTPDCVMTFGAKNVGP